jgi:hypothetical protein
LMPIVSISAAVREGSAALITIKNSLIPSASIARPSAVTTFSVGERCVASNRWAFFLGSALASAPYYNNYYSNSYPYNYSYGYGYPYNYSSPGYGYYGYPGYGYAPR